MNFGLQTITWGPKLLDVEHVMDFAKELGFKGIEFAQHPDVLPPIEDLLSLLAARELHFLGLTAGTLDERISYCGGCHPKYLYLENWDEEIVAEAVRSGFVLALHPHAFKEIRRVFDARIAMMRGKEQNLPVKLILDTAHLRMVGDDAVAALNSERDWMIAVHLKDWTPEFGRSVHRYAKGCIELGDGSAGIRQVINELVRMQFEGWVVAEQDYTHYDAFESVRRSAKWLRENGVLPGKDVRKSLSPPVPLSNTRRLFTAEKELNCIRKLSRTLDANPSGAYQVIVESLADLSRADHVSAWTYSPAQKLINLLAVYPEDGPNLEQSINLNESVSGRAVASQRIRSFDLTSTELRESFAQRQLLAWRPFRRLISLPVLQIGNPNHVRLLINLLFVEEPPSSLLEDLDCIAQDIASVASAALDEKCSVAAARTSLLAAVQKDCTAFGTELASAICSEVFCQGASLFLIDDSGEKLRLMGSTGFRWFVDENEQYMSRGEGVEGRAWDRNEPLLLPHRVARELVGQKGEEIKVSNRCDLLVMPLVRGDGKVIGVVRCRNKQCNEGEPAMAAFSDEDIAVLESMMATAVPHIEALADIRHRSKWLGYLAHELSNPVGCIASLVELMRDDLEDLGEDPSSFFSFDWLGDLESWTRLMSRLLDNSRFPLSQSHSLSLEAQRKLWLMADIIAPVSRQVELLCRLRGFRASKIAYGGFSTVPQLHIDRNQFQQVFLNLVSNSVKYCFQDPTSFRVQIDGKRGDQGYEIFVRDWGEGVAEGMEEVIFEEGVRARMARESGQRGQGLGLWVARQIIRAHGGGIKLTSNRLPTEFTITLPYSLAERPPSRGSIGGKL